MALYALRRLGAMVPTLLVVLALSFALVRLAPGSPFTEDRALAPEVRAALDARYGLNRPLWSQFARYVWALGHGDMGPSIRYPDRTVAELIALGLPHSLTLACAALVWGLGSGLTLALLGTWGLMVRRPVISWGVLGLTTVAQSLPSFVLGPILVLGLAVGVTVLPPAGWGTWQQLVLPALTLGTVLGAQVARLVYGTLSALRDEPFVKVARGKGLSPARVLFWHMLTPGLLPLITFMGPATAGILVGSVATERIFCVPGLGPYFVDAALNRDYFLVMGIVLLESVLLMVCNLLADLACAWLDPRVRTGAAP